MVEKFILSLIRIDGLKKIFINKTGVWYICFSSVNYSSHDVDCIN
ncbi:hypothetical protein SAMN05444280_11762 [Tangfeifania diversioriginum]|uniref:Uncharacterized protein n=1 Tax=Tangfeifania diversioriginum TaxID=1168035 RepID=A0A1M6ING5_9BACT|nr:hypothetical protein SAMN05444280_11762 [Tangfeifania diversioriginum]